MDPTRASLRPRFFSRIFPRPWLLVVVSLVTALLLPVARPAPALAQSRELTSSDRLALLYAPQLNFTRDGDPNIRLGIAEGRSEVSFTPSLPIRVLPEGEGGPEIELPAERRYTVRISETKPGRYRHLVIVDRLPVDARDRVKKVEQVWMQRGHLPEIVEVGGLFAVHGKVFDSRTILVGVAGTDDMREAARVRAKLEAKYGIQGSVHSEITAHPSGLLTMTGEGIDVTIRSPNVLWVSGLRTDGKGSGKGSGKASGKASGRGSGRGSEQDIVYTIPGIEKSYGGGVETRRYTGQLIFAPDRGGKMVAMVSLGAERVLKGTVPAETYASAPADALRAQAIAARNNMFSAIGVRNLADPYMLRADVMDQVYGGIGVEQPSTSAAVDATRGEVMFHDKKIIEAVYSSNAGGFTESNENVWDMEPRPWLRGQPDAPKGSVPRAFLDGISTSELDAFLSSDFPAFSKTAPVSSSKLYRWTKTVPADTARAWLKEHDRDIGPITNVEVERRGVSGRVVRLAVTGEKGKAVVERELNVRRLFGGLRSGLFTMALKRDAKGRVSSIDFRGAGFGHGVGMCQTGATGMASQGKGYRDILGHYYSGITITKLY